MERRRFLKNSLMSWGALALPLAASPSRAAGAVPSGKIRPQYIREEIPPFEIPPYKGQTYDDRVPDTLDIAERARLGVHALTCIADPEADYEIYGYWYREDFFRNPPVMVHDLNDWVQSQEGIMEALPLLRIATGSPLNSQVDPAWMKSSLKSIGPDGLVYLPLNGRPWSRLNAGGVNPVWRADGTKTDFNDLTVSQVTSAAICHREIATMTVYYLRDQNPMWKAAIEKIIQALSTRAFDRGDYCYFPPGTSEPNARVDPRAEMPVGSAWAVTWNSRLIQPLAQYYKVTGYEPARRLAGKLANYTRYHGEIFDPQGPWLLDLEARTQPRFRGEYNVVGLKLGGHGHGHGIALISVLDHAIVTGDRDLLEFSRASYEWARNPGPAYGVSRLVGWFPEWYVPHYPTCETCTLADMLAIAVKLTEAGVGDYWDDVDRWLRNQFAAVQLTSVDWIYRMLERAPHKPVAANETGDRVPERNIGAWANEATPNDWGRGISHCCTGNSARALYYVWEHMADFQNGQLRLNLLMNRASKWADIYSFIPYEGRVDFRMKEQCRGVRVRAPEWVKAGSPELICSVNGAARKLGWEGRYVEVGPVKAGDKVTLTFPNSERTVKERIGPQTYTLVLRGNTVVSIDPPGQEGPLYQDREKYRKGEVKWLSVKRFIPDQEIRW